MFSALASSFMPVTLGRMRSLKLGRVVWPVVSVIQPFGAFSACDYALTAHTNPRLAFTNFTAWSKKPDYPGDTHCLRIPCADIRALHPSFLGSKHGSLAFSPTGLSWALLKMTEFKTCCQLPLPRSPRFQGLTEFERPDQRDALPAHTEVRGVCFRVAVSTFGLLLRA